LSLTAELLGEGTSAEVRARLVRRLPAHLRLGLDTPRRIAAAAAVTLLVATSVLALSLRREREPDAVLVVLQGPGGDSVAPYGVPISLDASTGAALDVRHSPRAATGLPKRVAILRGSYQPQPGGDEWLFGRTSPDSGGEDVYLLRSDGAERRLTSNPGDDLGPHWSPDGARVVFSTDRWSTSSHSSIGVMDLMTGRVQRLTAEDARDVYPVWSPDGTRIAFVRTYYDDRDREVCWVAADGSSAHCVPTPGFSPGTVSGWRDADSLLVFGQAADGSTRVATLDLASGRLAAERPAAWASLSTDGRWLLCACTAGRADLPALRLVPLDRPDRAVRVEADSLSAEQSVLVRVPADRARPFLNRLTIGSPPDNRLSLGVPYRLAATAFDSHGDRMAEIPVLSWRTNDPSVATVDTLGVVHPRRVGELTVSASAGGWRKASAFLRVRAPAAVSPLTEDWAGPLSDRWEPFGDPMPAATIGPGGARVFWHRGDSSFTSGAYGRHSFDGRHGLAIEARLSTTIDRLTWQTVDVDLEGALDSAALARWDHRTGALPPSLEMGHACRAAFPGGEGAARRSTLALMAVTGRRVRLGPALGSGRWWTLRLQVFPDGRCGVAVNGRALAILPEPIRLDRRFVIVLQGYSYHTRMLIGPLKVWEGVPAGVDWERAGR
jgi:hypothetical protein